MVVAVGGSGEREAGTGVLIRSRSESLLFYRCFCSPEQMIIAV